MRLWLRFHLAVLLIAPAFLIGGVHPITQIMAAGAAFAFLLLCVFRRLLRSEEQTLWGWSGWSWIFLAAIGFTLLQLLPLPPWLIGLLSPDADETYRKVLGPLGLYPTGSWQTLSLSPGDTSVKWLRDLGALALFLGVGLWTRSREHLRMVMRFSVIGAAGVFSLTLFQTFLGVTGPLMGLYQTSGPVMGLLKGAPFVNLNHLGAYLMFNGLLCMFLVEDSEPGKERWMWLGALAILSIGVMGSLSRGAILSYTIGLIGFFYLAGRKMFGHLPPPKEEEAEKSKTKRRKKSNHREIQSLPGLAGRSCGRISYFATFSFSS